MAPFIKRRWQIMSGLCFGLAICYAQRTNLSVAIVEMADELSWSDAEKGSALSAFFWGYTAFMLPGGYFVLRFGGFYMFGASALISTVLTGLVPYCASELGVGYVYALRAITGAVEAATFPAIYALLAQWVPEMERGASVGLVFGAEQIGSILGYSITGFLTHRVNWQVSFYFFAVAGALASTFWLLVCSPDPDRDRWISAEERLEIIAGRQAGDGTHEGTNTSKRSSSVSSSKRGNSDALALPTNDLRESLLDHITGDGDASGTMETVVDSDAATEAYDVGGKGPVVKEVDDILEVPLWKRIVFTWELWPVYCQHFATNWSNYTLMTELPSYLDAQLDFDLEKAGLLLTAVFVAQWCGMALGGIMADRMLNGKGSYLSILSWRDYWRGEKLRVRTLMTSLSMFGCAVFLVIGGYARLIWPALTPYGVVGLIMPGLFLLGLCSGGWRTSVLELAPSQSAALYCFSNTMANVPGIATPLVTYLFTRDGASSSSLGWHAVFVLAAILNVSSGLIWLVGGSAEGIPGL